MNSIEMNQTNVSRKTQMHIFENCIKFDVSIVKEVLGN